MADKPSEELFQGLLLRSKNGETELPRTKSLTAHQQQPPTRTKQHNGINNSQLLQAFEQINQLLRSAADFEMLCTDFLDLCLNVFACDQAWLLPFPQSETEPWRAAFCKQESSDTCKKASSKSQELDELYDFFAAAVTLTKPTCLRTADKKNCPPLLCERFDCDSILLIAVTPAHETTLLLGLNQGRSSHFWPSDEIDLFTEFSRRLGDGLAHLDEQQNATHNKKQLQIRLQNTIDTMPSIMIGITHCGRISLWNQQAEKMFKVPAEIALDQELYQLLPGFPLSNKQLEKAFAPRSTDDQQRLNWEIDGHIKQLEISISPIADHDPAEAVIRIDDVTEQRRMEELFVQHEKMLSIGNLATGIAHEINNPLAGVLQNLQVVKNRLSPVLPKNIAQAKASGFQIEALHHYVHKRGILATIDTIMSSAIRAVDIVQNMLDFSRKNEDTFQLHDLRVLLDKTVDLASSNYNLLDKYDFRDINIVRSYAEDLPLVYCNPAQIQQVFLNLLNNGTYAMTHRLVDREGGLNTRPQQDKPRFTLRLQHQQGSIICEIEDNGCGMSEEVCNRIFEPFYTTKKMGEGIGLGMSICYFIITKNHNGRMRVESAPDHGSRFIIELPLAQN